MDQGFTRSGDAFNILVGPMNEHSARHLHPLMRDYLLCLSNVYTLLRQASEWGMRGMQGFPCCHCKKQLSTQSNKRRLVLESIVLIHNFHAELIGSNQIKTVFDPEYERYINLEGYDHIGQYYLRPEDFELIDDDDDDDNDL